MCRAVLHVYRWVGGNFESGIHFVAQARLEFATIFFLQPPEWYLIITYTLYVIYMLLRILTTM